MSIPTIAVDLIIDYNLLKMTWAPQINEHDIAVAFREIASALKKSEIPIDVIVDISNNPQFSMQTLFSEALGGPFKHPQLGMWVVVGTSRAAHIVANGLNRLSGQKKVVRFSTQDEALTYLATYANRRVG